jgi:hypothetical protein
MLLLAVLEDPSSATAQNDIDRIGDFVGFLERLSGDGCDVNRLLGGCRKLHDVASFARSAVQEADHQQDAETTVRRSAMLAQLEVSSLNPVHCQAGRTWLTHRFRPGYPPETLRR